VARKTPVKAAILNVICMISSEQEISLSEANRVTVEFVQKMKDMYGENIFPADSPHAFYFNLSVDRNGEITSALPTLIEIGKAKRFWSDAFTNGLRRGEWINVSGNPVFHLTILTLEIRVNFSVARFENNF
jgi:hypothetical protein